METDKSQNHRALDALNFLRWSSNFRPSFAATPLFRCAGPGTESRLLATRWRASGFVGEGGESARPMGNVIAKDGSLLFSDDRNGVIYRVSYTGGHAGSSGPVTIPAESMLRQNRTGVRSALAIASLQAQTTGKLNVTSPAFQD
jgi:hypothetical protein